MRNAVIAATLLLVSLLAQAQLSITTTLAQQTANNTSAATSYTTQVNGNLGAANVSKLPIRSLLYPGATTKLLAHVEPWWGSSSHIDIGYSSADTAQVQRQIQDITSRGLDGAVVDWYGPGSYEDGTVKTLFAQAELHPGFSLIAEIDVGAINWHSCYPTCSATTAAINLFTTMGNTFFASPAYSRMGGQPMAMEFGMETLALPSGAAAGWNIIDWSAVQSQVPGNMLLYHRNLGGFSKASSGGAFSWMEPKTLDVEPAGYDGTDESLWFYSNSASTDASRTVAAVWKGFNDIQADWAPPGGRHIEQNCGQTWLNTFAAINQYYSSSNQLAALQLVTWNDYEEGTEIESGIDNCLSLSVSLSGTNLQWTPSASENTVDHYTVYVSTDGSNLTSLGDFDVSTHALDLGTFTLPAAAYTVYVQAVGKPSIRNQMSSSVAYTVAAPAPAPAPATGAGGTSTLTRPARPAKVVTLTATPATQTVTSGQAALYTVDVAQENASDPVALSCSGLPAGMTCALSASTVTPDASGTPVQLTVAPNSLASASHPGDPSAPLLAVLLPGLAALGFRRSSSRRKKLIAVGMLLFVLLLTQVACGGGSMATPKTSTTTATTSAPQTYNITVTATSGDVVNSTVVTLTVN